MPALCYYILVSKEFLPPLEDDLQTKSASFKKWRKIGKILLSATMAISAIGYGYAQNQKLDRLQARVNQYTNKNSTNLNQLESEFARLNDIPQGVVTGSSLRPVPTIVGKVSETNKNQSDNATVEVLVKVKGSLNSYSPICTGTNVSYEDNRYVLLANHCLKAFETPTKAGKQEPSAVNVTSSVSGDFFIARPSEHNPGNHNWNPLARVDNIAVDESNLTDLALMQATQTKSYQSLATVPLKNIVSTSTSIKAGEAVSLYSLPASNNFAPVSEKGVFLGSFYSYQIGGLGVNLDLVGINPSSPESDACNFGGSGSSARFANGIITGPLSFRNNIGYGKSDTFYSPDNPKNSQITRFDIENETGYNLSMFSTICGYSIPIETSIPNAMKDQYSSIQGLVDVLNHPNNTIYAPEGGK